MAALALAACQQVKQDPEALRQAVITHVSTNAGLNMDNMTVEVRNAKFEGNTATADFLFVPKSMPSAAQTWVYKLESKDGKWAVSGKPSLQRGSMHSSEPPAPSGGQSLPEGHPPVGGQTKP